MSTALEQWGSAQGSATGAADDTHTDTVHEGDITGDGLEGAEHLEHEPHAEVDDAAVGAADDADAAALAAKKAKDVKTLKLVGAVAAAVVVGVGVMKARSNAQQVEIAQAQAQAQPAPDNSALAPTPAAASAVAQPVITERADTPPTAQVGTPPSPDFGLQAGAAPQPALVAAPPVQTAVLQPVAQAPAPVQPAASTAADLAVATRANAQQAPVLADAGKGVKSAPATKQADVGGGGTAPEVQKLRDDVASLRAAMADKDGAIAQLRSELDGLKESVASRSAAAQPRPAAHRQVAKPPAKTAVVAAPAAKASAPVSGITETVVSSPASATIAQPVPAKGKVRTDYRVYAMTDGRVWVVGRSNEPFQISLRAPLPDGSRVTSIDADKYVVLTTAGEIH